MKGAGDQWLHLVALLAGSCLSLAEGGEVARLRGGGGGTGPGTAGGHLDITQYSTVQYSAVQCCYAPGHRGGQRPAAPLGGGGHGGGGVEGVGGQQGVGGLLQRQGLGSSELVS